LFLIDCLGLIAGALGGSLAARQNEKYEYDVIGLFGLALVSALGGGITRQALAFADVRYLEHRASRVATAFFEEKFNDVYSGF